MTALKVGANFEFLLENRDESLDKQGFVLEGSSGCFEENQLVITKDGSKPISSISKKDYVLSYNEDTKQKEWKKVERTFKFNNKKKCYSITLKNGKVIKCTDNHKFYYKGEWKTIESIIRLIDYGKMENNTEF